MGEYSNPYTASRRWLKGNLHGHTCCGRFMDVSESGPMFASLGYDFMAITDHNKAPDEEQWRIWQDQAELVLIPGEENGKLDHILELGVFGVTETPSEDFSERAQSLCRAGGFVAACHPQEYETGEDNIWAGLGDLHAFEIYNGLREGRGCDEVANIRIWDSILTSGERIWGIATDDFHCQYTTPGHGWVCVQVPEEDDEVTWQKIVGQLKAGAFYSSTSPSFNQIEMESSTIRASSDRWVDRICVIGPGGKPLYEQEGSELSWEVEPGHTYFRLEIQCGVRRAWSQPFYQNS